MDLNRDELRRELRAIDADNKAAMPSEHSRATCLSFMCPPWWNALRRHA